MICPVCHRPPPSETVRGDAACLPSTCPAWNTEARYDRDTRAWLPVDQDGHDLKGRT